MYNLFTTTFSKIPCYTYIASGEPDEILDNFSCSRRTGAESETVHRERAREPAVMIRTAADRYGILQRCDITESGYRMVPGGISIVKARGHYHVGI